MIAALKRLVPWINGLLAYLVWRVGGILASHRPRNEGPVTGRVCVIQINSLGDVLMVTPLLRALIETLGSGRVDVVVSKRSAPLLQTFPGLGTLIRLESGLAWRRPPSILAFTRVARTMRRGHYDAVLDTSRLIQSAWMTFLSRPNRGIGFRLPRQLGPVQVDRLDYLYTDEVEVDPGVHMIRQNLALLSPLGIPAQSDRMEFTPAALDSHATTTWLATRGLTPDDSFAVVHPGAKWPPKRWPAERFRDLAQRLQASGLDVILVGDTGDRQLLQAVTGGITTPPHVLAGDLGIGSVGALIQRARLLIGNDSGLMHLASAVGTPVLGLFGPTYPDRTGPLNSVGKAVAKPIACRPCRLYFTKDRCERGHNYCMDLIEVDEVWEAAKFLLVPAPAAQPTIK